MGSPSELSLDVKPNSYSLFLRSFGDEIDQTHKLQEFLSRLEEERLKIDAFKRELPLCMQLLNNVMEASRQQLENYQTNNGLRPILEEFIPLKYPSPDRAEKTNLVEKTTWMDSAQLWSQTDNNQTLALKETEQSFCVASKAGLDNKQRAGGAFLPFSKERSTCNTRVLPELALASGEKEFGEIKFSDSENGTPSSKRKSRENCNGSHQGGGGTVADQNKGVVSMTADGQAVAGQTHRKARRCWSPDLHRSFVNALQQLGGSHVATPKQIRELMKVDGLTNDEVKSHLQKYRLHNRRPSPIPQTATATAPAPQLVVLGGIWVSPEYATATHPVAPAIYGAATMAAATAGSTPYCPSGVHQDFYSQLNPLPHQLHHHHVYKTSLQTQSSPQSEVGGTDQSESMEEEGKSESGSWKGDSAEKEGGRGLLSLRRSAEEEERESSGSEITLKF